MIEHDVLSGSSNFRDVAGSTCITLGYLDLRFSPERCEDRAGEAPLFLSVQRRRTFHLDTSPRDGV